MSPDSLYSRPRVNLDHSVSLTRFLSRNDTGIVIYLRTFKSVYKHFLTFYSNPRESRSWCKRQTRSSKLNWSHLVLYSRHTLYGPHEIYIVFYLSQRQREWVFVVKVPGSSLPSPAYLSAKKSRLIDWDFFRHWITAVIIDAIFKGPSG